MAITDPMVLPPDVILAPVEELPEEIRCQLSWEPGDYAITRPRLRTPSRLIDAQAAELLAEFKTPRTIVEAVLRFCRHHDLDSEQVLDEAFPLLRPLLAAGFLVAAGEPAAGAIEPSLRPGEVVAGWTVMSCLHVLEDTELYQVRRAGAVPGAPCTTAALKLARRSGGEEAPPPAASPELAREAAVLGHLAGRTAPALLMGGGQVPGRGGHFLLLEWCDGVDVATAAAELRAAGDDARLLQLARGVAEAYADLHRRGVVHGDVHPHNALVDRSGGVRLVDFGLALREGASPELTPRGRGGLGIFFEPEYASAVLADQPLPPPSRAGEQHAVAALLYLLFCGAPYLDFSLERTQMMRQIAERPPLALETRGVPSWPGWKEVNAVLARALAKRPADRFGSMDELAAALAGIAVRAAAAGEEAEREQRAAGDAAGPPPGGLSRLREGRRPPVPQPPQQALLERVLRRVAPGGALWRDGIAEPPRASVSFGSAGIALALYRIALAREDAALLATADLWAEQAVAAGDDEEGFASPRRGLPARLIGRVSPFHSRTGPLLVRALVAHAQGDLRRFQDAARAFAGWAGESCPSPDLTLGRAGALLGAAILAELWLLSSGASGASGAAGAAGGYEAAGAARPAGDPSPSGGNRAEAGRGGAPPPALGDLGAALLDGLWRELDPLPPVSPFPRPPLEQQPPGAVLEAPVNLGMAHGRAGLLYASLRWCRAVGAPAPRGLALRLGELGAAGGRWRRGLRWRWSDPEEVGEAEVWGPPTMPGWCNGSAGMVHLWTLAESCQVPQVAPESFRELALGAAWNAWESEAGGGDLCCGLAGRAYSLLNLHRCGGGDEWLARAHRLAERAAGAISASPEEADSLFRGELGVAVLAADLERPESAAMPLCEEGTLI